MAISKELKEFYAFTISELIDKNRKVTSSEFEIEKLIMTDREGISITIPVCSVYMHFKTNVNTDHMTFLLRANEK